MNRLNGNKYLEEVKSIIGSLITHILEIPVTVKEIDWANILSVRNISKQRMIYPTRIFNVDGDVLTKISATIKSQIALR